jgi:glycosyltransferase involved in cell wall biosynthesis
MPRVMIVHNDSNYFLRHRLPIAHELLRRSIEVHVMAGGERIIPPETESWTFEHFDIERFRFSLTKDIAFAARFVRRVLAFKPDSVLLVTLKPVLYGGLLGLVTRLVSRRPATMVMLIPGLGRLMSPVPEAGRRKLPRRMTEACLSWISNQTGVRFVFETAHDKAYLAGLGVVDEHKATVVKGAGVDPAIYFPGQRDGKAGKLRILFASRLMASKGLGLFLEAASAFSKEVRVEFLVAGLSEEGDPDRIPVESLADMPEITFLGQVSAMADLIRSCDVICLPTMYGEGIPRILIEAAACGVAAIGSDIPGCHEIIVDGETGFILRGDTELARLSGLKALVSRYLEQPGLAAEQGLRAVQHFHSGKFEASTITLQFVEMLGFRQSPQTRP